MLRIVIDTREQQPWHFPRHLAAVSRGTLSAGDYALEGDRGFAIERKSLPDFVGTISSGWERFRRELERMPAGAARVAAEYTPARFVEDYVRLYEEAATAGRRA